MTYHVILPDKFGEFRIMRLLIPHTFMKRILRLSLIFSPASSYAVRSEIILELLRICFSNCLSFIDLFAQADLEFPWVVGLLRLWRMVIWYMFIDQCIGSHVPVKLVAGWLWSVSQLGTVFCVTLILHFGNWSFTCKRDPFSLRGVLSNKFVLFKKG